MEFVPTLSTQGRLVSSILQINYESNVHFFRLSKLIEQIFFTFKWRVSIPLLLVKLYFGQKF